MDLISTATSFSKQLLAFILLDEEWRYQDQDIGGHIASCQNPDQSGTVRSKVSLHCRDHQVASLFW
jgi:hypothetical protein